MGLAGLVYLYFLLDLPYRMKETIRDPRGSGASKNTDLLNEKEKLKAMIARKEEEVEHKVEQVTNKYYEILQQVG